MEILDTFLSRRSIREYQENIPDDELINKIIEAARWAPSGLNNQPWRFVIIRDKTIRERIASCTKYSRIVKGAPVLICVFLDQGESYNRDKDIMAVGACIQNMLLCIHQLGLGACWLGEILNKKEKVSEILQLDSDYELMAVISLGYSTEKITKGCRKSTKSLIIKRFD